MCVCIVHISAHGDSEGNFCPQCGRPGFDLWVWKIPWRRKWQPTLVLLPGKSYGRSSLVGHSPWAAELDTTEQIHFHFHFHGVPKQNEYIRIPFLFQTSIQKPQASSSEKCSSVQFIRPVVSDSLQPHESQHTRPPRPSPTPGVYSNSCPLSR